MTDRDVMQQALEALASYSIGERLDASQVNDLIVELDAALEQQAEPPPEWPLIKNILSEYGLDAIAFVAEFKAAQQQAEPWGWYSAKADDFMTHSIRKEHERLGSHTHKVGKFDLPLYTSPQQQAEPVAMRMPKVGDKVVCLEDESLGTVVSLTAGGSPDITFDDGTRGTYMVREFAELFSYVTPPQRKWQGLEIEEIKATWSQLWYDLNHGKLSAPDTEVRNNIVVFGEALEAKLKEKNSD